MSKRRGIWEDGLNLNTLWADIANLCTQLGITVNYSQLRDPQHLNGILIQLSDISNVPLSSGPKNNEDLRQFIDKVSETMELTPRKRPVKRRRVIVVVSRESDSEDLEYPKLLILVMIMMNDVSIDMFGSDEIDAGDEAVCPNESVGTDDRSAETVERENNIANDSDDVADILEQLRRLRH
jgi:hypothetical protein